MHSSSKDTFWNKEVYATEEIKERENREPVGGFLNFRRLFKPLWGTSVFQDIEDFTESRFKEKRPATLQDIDNHLSVEAKFIVSAFLEAKTDEERQNARQRLSNMAHALVLLRVIPELKSFEPVAYLRHPEILTQKIIALATNNSLAQFMQSELPARLGAAINALGEKVELRSVFYALVEEWRAKQPIENTFESLDQIDEVMEVVNTQYPV